MGTYNTPAAPASHSNYMNIDNLQSTVPAPNNTAQPANHSNYMNIDMLSRTLEKNVSIDSSTSYTNMAGVSYPRQNSGASYGNYMNMPAPAMTEAPAAPAPRKISSTQAIYDTPTNHLRAYANVDNKCIAMSVSNPIYGNCGGTAQKLQTWVCVRGLISAEVMRDRFGQCSIHLGFLMFQLRRASSFGHRVWALPPRGEQNCSPRAWRAKSAPSVWRVIVCFENPYPWGLWETETTELEAILVVHSCFSFLRHFAVSHVLYDTRTRLQDCSIFLFRNNTIKSVEIAILVSFCLRNLQVDDITFLYQCFLTAEFLTWWL